MIGKAIACIFIVVGDSLTAVPFSAKYMEKGRWISCLRNLLDCGR